MLIGKKKGSEVEVAAPGGAMEYEVLRVEWSMGKPRFGPVLVGNQAKSVKRQIQVRCGRENLLPCPTLNRIAPEAFVSES